MNDFKRLCNHLGIIKSLYKQLKINNKENIEMQVYDLKQHIKKLKFEELKVKKECEKFRKKVEELKVKK